MGSPTIYWYPSGDSVLEVLTLPQLTRLEPVDAVDVEDGYTGNLKLCRTYRGTRRRVHITIERQSLLTTAGKAYYRSLIAVVEHLRGGGAIGFSQDHACTWAGYASSAWKRRASYVAFGGNAFSSWSSSAIPTAGQEIVIESPPIYPQSEQHTCTALGGGTQISLGETLTFDYSNAGPAMVRWYRFWPALVLPADQLRPPMTNERGTAWTLDITLEVAADIFWAAGDQYTSRVKALGIGDTVARATGSVATLDELLNSAKLRWQP